MKRKYKIVKPEYNWFGTPAKSNKRLNVVSFMGGTAKKKIVIPIRVNYLGVNNNNPSFGLRPSTMFVRDKITTKKRKLSKWGDVDMDGSPNYFDCDPKNFLKDAKPIEQGQTESALSGYVKRKIRGNKLLIGEKALTRAANLRKSYNESMKANKEIMERNKSLAQEKKRIIKEREGAGLRVTKKQRKEAEAIGRDILENEKRQEKFGKQVAAGEFSAKKTAALEKAVKITGPAGKVAIRKVGIMSALEAGKTPRIKDLQAYEKAVAETTVGARTERLADALRVGGVSGIITGKGLKGGKTFSREIIARSARVRKMTKEAAGLLFSPSLNARSFNSEPRGRGRPAGPSGEYKIGGKPVYEEEFRQWEAKQNALNRMTPSESQSQTLNPEYVAYIEAQQSQRNQQVQPQQYQDTSMDGAMDVMDTEPIPSDQAPQTEGLTNEAVQAIAEAKSRPYTRAQPNEIREAQHAAQSKDQILNAPNFMKGELKAAGGGILTATGPQIMDAPNVFKGEMRNVYQSGDVPAVRLSERPQTNPYGNEYLEIEIGSGKPVIRKRITEKWMTGEAL